MRALILAAVALAALGTAACGGQEDPARRDPCAAANRTPDTLENAVGAFRLTVPDDAADLSFATNEGGMAYSLTLVFRTTPDGLAEFSTMSKFPDTEPSEVRTLAAGTPACDLDSGFTYSATVRADSTYPSLIRSLAVDTTTAGAPRVLVVAAVL